jgi:threonine/homoserine/homoserine lactone efflux protein
MSETVTVTASLVGAVLALALLTVLPGPDVAVVTRLALSHGSTEALRGSLGIVSGLLVWGLLTVAGLAALLAASATAYTVVKYVGAGYLVLLGVRALWHSSSTDASAQDISSRTGAGTGFRVGFVSNLLNPKIAVFYTGLLPSLVPDGAPHGVTLIGLVLVHGVLSLAWLVLYAALVVRASGFLHRPGIRQALERVTGVVLVGFGVRVAATGRH